MLRGRLSRASQLHPVALASLTKERRVPRALFQDLRSLTGSRAQGQALLHVVARDACLSYFFLTICFSARRAFFFAPTHWRVRWMRAWCIHSTDLPSTSNGFQSVNDASWQATYGGAAVVRTIPGTEEVRACIRAARSDVPSLATPPVSS